MEPTKGLSKAHKFLCLPLSFLIKRYVYMYSSAQAIEIIVAVFSHQSSSMMFCKMCLFLICNICSNLLIFKKLYRTGFAIWQSLPNKNRLVRVEGNLKFSFALVELPN